MLNFLTHSRIIRADLRPLRPIFFVYDLLGLAMAWSFWAGWQDLQPFRAHDPVVTVSLTEIALLGFCGFYGLRLAMFIALIRNLRMPQTIEWIVAVVPATVAVICIVLGSPMERGYATSLGYRYCDRFKDPGTRSSLYVFASRGTSCPARATRPAAS